MASPKHNQKTAALYARFSDEKQNDRSIDDQFSLCKTYAKREGINIAYECFDKARTGATQFDRPGLARLMELVQTKKIDVLLVESLDRLSRSPVDLPAIFHRLKFFEVELRAVNEGTATDMHVGIRGMVGAMFLKDLGDKIRRHHLGRVNDGHVMGAVSYGYRDIPGKPGEREIYTEHATIVRRIFTEYANGVSPRAIAVGLTRDGIVSPSGEAVWSHQSFMGGGGKSGLLGNRLYVGELVYNRHHNVRKLDDNGVIARLNPEQDHVVKAVPHLRIIDQDLWDAAQAVRESRSLKRSGTGTGRGSGTRRVVRRSNHLLSGLLRCGQCHGHMIFASTSRGKQFVACAAAKVKSTCQHGKLYDIDLLKKLVVDNFRKHLIDPKRHAEAMRAYHAEYAAQATKDNAERTEVEKKVNKLTVQISRLVDAIADSDTPVKELVASMEAKEAERVGLVERLRLLQSTNMGNVIDLHPAAIDRYRETIEELHAKLSTDTIDPDVAIAFRNIMDSIVVQPTGYRQPYVVDAYGRLSAIMGVKLFPQTRSTEEIFANEGVSEDRSAAITANLSRQVQRYRGSENGVVSLGRWAA